MSASARLTAANSAVPSWPPSGTSTLRSSRSGILRGLRGSVGCGARRRAWRGRRPAWRRSGRPRAGAMSGRPCRVSRTRRGPASQASSTAKRGRAQPRRRAPRRMQGRQADTSGAGERPGTAEEPTSGRCRVRSAARRTACSSQRGSVIGPAAPGWPARAPGRLCSCRSAHTSRDSRRSGRRACAGAAPPGMVANSGRPSSSLGPGGRPVVGADDHRADAVVAAVLVLLHPHRVAVVAAGKVAAADRTRGPARGRWSAAPGAARPGPADTRRSGRHPVPAGAKPLAGAAAAQYRSARCRHGACSRSGRRSAWARRSASAVIGPIQQRVEAEIVVAGDDARPGRRARRRCGVHVVGQPGEAGSWRSRRPSASPVTT